MVRAPFAMSTQETPENKAVAPLEREPVTPSASHAEPPRAHDDPQPGGQAHAPPAPARTDHAQGGAQGGDGAAPGNDKDRSGDAPVAAASTEAGAPGVPGAPGTGKRKRRRRRKKPHGEGAGATQAGGPPGEGESAEGEGDDGDEVGEANAYEAGAEGVRADGTQGPRREGDNRGPRDPNAKKKDRPRRDRGADHHAGPPRERTPFNLGDVVFGKIVAITDDALFIDLSGKANAIFDRREMDMPEEPANTPATPEEDDDAPGAAVVPKALLGKSRPHSNGQPDESPESASDAPTATEMPEDFAAFHAATAPQAQAAPQEAAPQETAPQEAAPQEAAPQEAAPQEAAPQEAQAAAVGEATAEAPDAESAGSGAPAAPDPPAYLPPVVLEVGANFVGVVHNDGARGGLVVLTRHPRRAPKAKPMVLQAFKDKDNNAMVTGLVTGVIKGGVEVDIEGLRAFAPGSHMDIRLGADLHHHVGARLQFTVTQYGKKGRDVVLSRRKMLDGEAKAHREAALAKLQIGAVVDGVVKSVVAFGAFIDVGGIEGLVPLQEMSHNRSDGPTDCFTPGETTQVKIIRVDERGKVWLSRKATITDPWVEATKKYTVGSRHKGKIVRLQPFGVFVELETGIDGLIHAADLSIKRFEHPSEIVKIGDEIDVVVAGVDGGMHKIGLHPAPTGAAADEPHQRVQVHKMLKVCVVAIDPGGLVVRVLGATGRHARGFIPAGATGTARGTELRKVFPIGKELEAKVIDLDPKRGEVKLSIKAMNEDTERNAYKAYQQQVKREAKFGTFGDLLSKKMGKD